jgi:hypothetical protein
MVDQFYICSEGEAMSFEIIKKNLWVVLGY